MSEYNPYDFVPFAETVARKTRKEWQKAGERLSGHLICKIKPISPLCIDPDHIFKKDTSEVYIPATSLKGMLRQLIATLAKGCGEFIDRDYWYVETKKGDKKGYTKINPNKPDEHSIYKYTIEYFVAHNKFSSNEDYADSDFRSCGHIIDSATDGAEPRICRTCNLFGYTAENDSLAGRIHIQDSERGNVNLVRKSVLRLERPRVYRWGFYFRNKPNYKQYPASPDKPMDKFQSYPFDVTDFQGSGKKPESPAGHKIVHYQHGIYNGRKFYRHERTRKVHKLEKDNPQKLPVREIYVLEPNAGVCFTQKLYFNDITSDDLGLLIFALTLEDKMYHKLGYAKPLGAGTVHITVSELCVQRADRYGSLTTKLEERDITPFRDEFKRRHGILNTAQFKKLQDIWDSSGYDIAYPDLKKFFGKKKVGDIDFRAMNLDEYNEGKWRTHQ